MAGNRTISSNTFGHNTRIHQGDQIIHNHASRDSAADCLADLFVTDPQDDKSRIEELKGGLLKNSYSWILDHKSFVEWRDDSNGCLLWIRADPGKGKTMLLCGIIDELTKENHGSPLAFFFCQETESRINSATSVLRGLIYMLVKQRESLMKHLLQRYKGAAKHLFEDANAWVALSGILTTMLQDPASKGTVLVIDALDECVTDLPKLLGLITKLSNSDVKLIVSSRNWLEVDALSAASQNVMLQLELNADAVSNAVEVFINHRVQRLPQFRTDDGRLKETIRQLLSDHAHGTFLWVAIVCKAVQDPRLSKHEVVQKVKEFPQGLVPLYQRMINYILSSPSAHLHRQVLATMATVYRPVTVQEMASLVLELRPFGNDLDEIRRVVQGCGSFLYIRQDVVYFVHQSAKDFLLNPSSDFVDASQRHYLLSISSLDVLSKTLKRDLFNLGSPGFLINDVKPPIPNPMDHIQYCRDYWVQHLRDSCLVINDPIMDSGEVLDKFLRTKFLNWLEAIILAGKLWEGMKAIQLLNDLVRNVGSQHIQYVVMSASRFAHYFRPALETTPLQLYTAGLLFSPPRTQELFFGSENKDPCLLRYHKVDVPDEWPGYLSTLTVPQVHAVVFSPEGLRVAAKAGKSSIAIWDQTSSCLGRLDDVGGDPVSTIFSSNGQIMACQMHDNTIDIWHLTTQKRLQTLILEEVTSRDKENVFMAFAEDNRYLIWAGASVVLACDLHQGNLVAQKIKLEADTHSRAISTNGRRVAVAIEKPVRFHNELQVEIFDPITGQKVQSFIVGSFGREAQLPLYFSEDGSKLAMIFQRLSLKSLVNFQCWFDWEIWDADRGLCLRRHEFKQLFDANNVATFSKDGSWLAWLQNNTEVVIGGLDNRGARALPSDQAQAMFGSLLYPITQVTFSADSKHIAVCCHHDGTVNVWDAFSEADSTNAPHVQMASVRLSTDRENILTQSADERVQVWDAATGRCLHTGPVLKDVRWFQVAFSRDFRHMAIAHGANLKICNLLADDPSIGDVMKTKTMSLLTKVYNHASDKASIRRIAFSDDGEKIASVSQDSRVCIRDVRSGAVVQTWWSSLDMTFAGLKFSRDGREVFLWTMNQLQIWDIASGTLRLRRAYQCRTIHDVDCSTDSELIAICCDRSTFISDQQTSSFIGTINLPQDITEIAFDPDSNYSLQTDSGTFSLMEGGLGFHLSLDGKWIMKDEERIVWLPVGFRVQSKKVSGNTLVIAGMKGGFIIAQFSV